MSGEPTQAAIAKALGLAKSRVTAMKKQGMPVHSVDAARAWRREHVAPIMRTALRAARTRNLHSDVPKPATPTCAVDYVAAMRHAAALGDLAAVAIVSGTFDAIEPALRVALAAIPPEHRAKLPGLPFTVWDALCAEVLALVEPEPGGPDGTAPPMSDDEANWMGAFWYRVAAGEVRPAAPA